MSVEYSCETVSRLTVRRLFQLSRFWVASPWVLPKSQRLLPGSFLWHSPDAAPMHHHKWCMYPKAEGTHSWPGATRSNRRLKDKLNLPRWVLPLFQPKLELFWLPSRCEEKETEWSIRSPGAQHSCCLTLASPICPSRDPQPVPDRLQPLNIHLTSCSSKSFSFCFLALSPVFAF